MANTRIQIKRATVTTVPPNGSLQVAEPAYSYAANTLYIGGSDGTGVLPIGGKFYIDEQSLIFATVNAAFLQANNASSTGMDYPYVNTSTAASNTWANTVGTAGNNYTISVGASGNLWANAVGTAGNNYTNSVGASGNLWANAVATAGNNYTISVGAAGNNWSNTIATAGNNYTISVGASGNNWANTINTAVQTSFAAVNNYTVSVGTAGNNYTDAVGAASNNWSNATFVKLTATTQTITGDLAITGNLTFLGNAATISSNNLIVGDSLIYLAANNYTGTDILDIGFVANYGNATAANVHTGLIRDATTKQYYLFQDYDAELTGNNQAFVMGANNSSYATLNADVVAGNLSVSGINVYNWVASAFTTANSSNGWANTVATAGNNYTISVGASGNNWANTINTAVQTSFSAVNNYTISVGASSNNWANTINTAIQTQFPAVNNYTISVGAASNNWANSVGTAGNNYSISIGAAGNNYSNTLNTVIFQTFANAANITSGTLASARLSGSYTGITGVGTITSGTWNGSTVTVDYGGTGITSATLNGVLFGGGGTSALQVTAAGTEGQVLQANATGVPQFAMLDGGTF